MDIFEDVILTAENNYQFYKHFTDDVLPEVVEKIRAAKWSKAEQDRIFTAFAEEAVRTYNSMSLTQKYKPTPSQKKELAKRLYENFRELILDEL